MCILNWKARDVGSILPWWEAILGKTKNEMWFLPLNFASLAALLNGTLRLRNIYNPYNWWYLLKKSFPNLSPMQACET